MFLSTRPTTTQSCAALADFDKVLSLGLIEKADARREELQKQAVSGGTEFTVISESGEQDAECEAQLTGARTRQRRPKTSPRPTASAMSCKAQGIEVTDIPNGAKWEKI